MNTPKQPSDLIAHTVRNMEISAIKRMAILSAQVKDSVSLTWGLPSFETPEYIRNHVKQQLNNDPDIGKYSLPDGLKELRQLVAKHHAEETGAVVDADKNVMITAGNMQGMDILLQSIINPGDEIILPDPCFASHIQQINLCGGKTVFWPLDETNGWQPDLSRLPALISNKTKAIIIVSPANPTGTIFTKDDLLAIAQLAQQHNLLVIVDDPYSLFLYENNQKFFNLASATDYADHIAYLFTFSKCYAMSGWRLAYMILPEWLKTHVLKVHDANIICTPRISQVAGIAALSHPPDHFKEFKTILARRRELICQRLDRMPQVFDYVKPEGAYYVFPKILAKHTNSNDFACNLLNKTGVVVTPGSAFGPSGEHHVRMAFCVEDDAINEAFDRIDKYF